jgi:hypothetical protein
MKNKVSNKISNTQFAQNFKQTEEYKKIEEMRKEMQEFKHNLREELDAT